MTFSLLVRDAQTNAIAGVAATGSLCVGGWVLRGRWGTGMSASQGAAPSTIWGESVLDGIAGGQSPTEAIEAVVAPDEGRDWRQLTVLDMRGRVASHDGGRNTPEVASLACASGIAAGNMLERPTVLEALIGGYENGKGSLPERLITGLAEAQAAGGDIRGLSSAALLVLREDEAPLTLRIDYAEAPIEALSALLERATSGDYAKWASQVPTPADPYRVLKG
ncbi:DUF1028 domain-containing protein [Vannielia sp.]|uniref:DUF1028 domain-containing protein n=1 Tax=Vannielia sp. TaxID=2813045 RepID=UPI00261AC9B8|nr:DUF1028 domain-containing protein [Vannielia sp.]MDF1872330.1 DUF1028 domain-containing protein [Vannielia sp.]